MKLKVEINEVDQKLINELQAHTGFDIDVLFKVALRLLHKKELPVYARKLKVKEQEEDPVVKCKKLGGEHFLNDQGRHACRITKGSLIYTELL